MPINIPYGKRKVKSELDRLLVVENVHEYTKNVKRSYSEKILFKRKVFRRKTLF